MSRLMAIHLRWLHGASELGTASFHAPKPRRCTVWRRNMCLPGAIVSKYEVLGWHGNCLLKSRSHESYLFGAKVMLPVQLNSNTSAINANQGSQPFHNLKGEARACLDRIGMDMNYTRGGILFGEGEPSKQVFFLSRGRMKLSVTSREGKTAILRIAEAGDILGLSAALNGAAYEVTAEAMEP